MKSSNPDLKIVNTTEARICGIPKTVKPPLSSLATPQKVSSSPSAAPLAHLSNSTGSGNNTGITTTTTTNIPIVLRPLAGGICPTGYHLVSGAVCIKDLPSAALTKIATTTVTIPTSTTKATKSFPIPSSTTTKSQPSGTSHTNNNSNANNEENFHTKILKSFNKKFK